MPGSIVQPLLITDLPTFCRWRGLPPWGKPELEQLVDVCDRLVVDSSEWRGLPAAYRKLETLLRPDRRLGHRLGAVAWAGAAGSPAPGRRSRGSRSSRSPGPKADALLLAGWLRSTARPSGEADAPLVGAARARRRRRRARRAASRRCSERPATCSRPSSTSSAATRSTRPRSAQLADVEDARSRRRSPRSGRLPPRRGSSIGAQSQIARPDRVERDVGGAFGDQHVRPEVAEAAHVPGVDRPARAAAARARRGRSRPRAGRSPETRIGSPSRTRPPLARPTSAAPSAGAETTAIRSA